MSFPTPATTAKERPTAGLLDGQIVAQKGDTLFFNGDAIIASGKTSITVTVNPGDVVIVTSMNAPEKASYDGRGEYVSSPEITAPILTRADGQVQMLKIGSYRFNVNYDEAFVNEQKAKGKRGAAAPTALPVIPAGRFSLG